jgi:hypothetical protein
MENNTYELRLYKALSFYLKHHKHLFDTFSFSKIGFHMGWMFGVILGLYLTKIVAIFLGDLNLKLALILGILFGLLAVVGGLIFLSASIGSIIGWLLCKFLNISRANLKSEEKLKEAIKNSKVKNLPLRVTKKDFRYTKRQCFKNYRLYYYSE